MRRFFSSPKMEATLPRSTSAASKNFPLMHPHYTQLSINPDLSQLTLYTKQSEFPRLLSDVAVTIGDTLDRLPLAIDCRVQKNQLTVSKLFDINLLLRDLVSQIKVEDPAFFLKLKQHVSEIEEDEENVGPMLDLLKTPLSAKYFVLQMFRQEGMQHAMEIPLKTLRQQTIITHDELTTLITHVWVTASLLRKNAISQELDSSDSSQFVPFVFRP